MHPHVITKIYRILIVVFISSSVHGQNRKITSSLNPGCGECSNSSTLVYIRALGAQDTIHQIWDFTKHLPTVILVVGSINSSLSIQWDRTVPTNFAWSELPLYSFATVIDSLYEYDDLDDSGSFDPRRPYKEYRFTRTSWALEDIVLTDKEVMVQMHGHINNDGLNGVVFIKFDLFPFKDYAAELPHLIHTANSTQVDVSLERLAVSREYNASRFAVHLVLASSEDPASTLHYVMRKSLDDEHTPGVFEIIEIKTPSLFDGQDGGYLQFRPIGYTARERNVGSSTMAHVSSFNRTSLPQRSTVATFYKKQMLLVQDMVVSFGDSSDGFYRQHNYTAWSFTMGYGTPPVESFSVFVVAVITAGLTVPALLALSGVAVVLRRRWARDTLPTRLTNED
ncbi:glycosylated lysosomal membrane protein-like [Leptidea sinapis]|uniref:glycosylated lysosomal membrane protein-like n=1 Tax=Leptidea sinapis TaxID=189913 RepID=UPI002124896E|nr:glycosylated lysosomal membrane protein-like [Leptidea sinapis]